MKLSTLRIYYFSCQKRWKINVFLYIKSFKFYLNCLLSIKSIFVPPNIWNFYLFCIQRTIVYCQVLPLWLILPYIIFIYVLPYYYDPIAFPLKWCIPWKLKLCFIYLYNSHFLAKCFGCNKPSLNVYCRIHSVIHLMSYRIVRDVKNSSLLIDTQDAH